MAILLAGCDRLYRDTTPAIPLDPKSVALPTFPDLPKPKQIEGGIDQYAVELGIEQGQPGHADRVRVFTPNFLEGEKLPCVFVVPAGATPYSGMTIDGADTDALKTLAMAGFVVVLYETDGNIAWSDEITLFDLAEPFVAYEASHAGLVNARNAIEFALAKLPFVDPDRLFASGHSSAGRQALLLAAFDDRIKGCLTFAPQVAIDIENQKDLEQDKMYFPSRFADSLQNFMPESYIDQLSCPLYFAQGDKDEVTPKPILDRFVARLKNQHTPVVVDEISGGDHYVVAKRGLEKGIAWLRNQSGLQQRSHRRGEPRGSHDDFWRNTHRTWQEYDAGLARNVSHRPAVTRFGSDFCIRDAVFLDSIQSLVLSGHPTGLVAFSIDDLLGGELEAAQMQMNWQRATALATDGRVAFFIEGREVMQWDPSQNLSKSIASIGGDLNTDSPGQLRLHYAAFPSPHLMISDGQQSRKVDLPGPAISDTAEVSSASIATEASPTSSALHDQQLLSSLLQSPGVEKVFDRQELETDGLPEQWDGLFYLFDSGKFGLFWKDNSIQFLSIENRRSIGSEPFLTVDGSSRRSKRKASENEFLLSAKRKVPKAPSQYGYECSTEWIPSYSQVAPVADQRSESIQALRRSRFNADLRGQAWFAAAVPMAFQVPDTDLAILVTPDTVALIDPKELRAPSCEIPTPVYGNWDQPVEFNLPPGAELVSATVRWKSSDDEGEPIQFETDTDQGKLRWLPSLGNLGTNHLQWDVRTDTGIERQRSVAIVDYPNIELPRLDGRVQIDAPNNRVMSWKTIASPRSTQIGVVDLEGNSLHSFVWPGYSEQVLLQGDSIVLMARDSTKPGGKTTILRRVSLSQSKQDEPAVISEIELDAQFTRLSGIGDDLLELRETRQVESLNPADLTAPRSLSASYVLKASGAQLEVEPALTFIGTGWLNAQYDRFDVIDGVLRGGKPARSLLLCELPKSVAVKSHIAPDGRLDIGGVEIQIPRHGDYPSYRRDPRISTRPLASHRVTKGTYVVAKKPPRLPGNSTHILVFYPATETAEPIRVPLSILSSNRANHGLQVTPTEVFVHDGNRLARFDRKFFEEDVSKPEVDIIPVQETFALSGRRSTLVKYRTRGASSTSLQLFTRDRLSEPIFEQSSENAEFEIALDSHLDVIKECIFATAIQSAPLDTPLDDLNDLNAPHVRAWIKAQQDAYKLVTGKRTSEIPVELKALVTAESASGWQVGLVHSYVLLVRPSALNN